MENQSLSPTTEKTPEQIQAEMAQTRESLTEKVAALENQVVGTVQTAADTLTGTVDAVKELVTSAPGAVTDTVKQAADVVGEKVRAVFDISGHVREHPWTSVGVSALLGCMTGWFLSRGREPRERLEPVPTFTPSAVPPSAPSAPHEPGIFDGMVSMIGRKLREMTENAIDAATGAVNQTVRENVPKLVDAAAERLTPEGR